MTEEMVKVEVGRKVCADTDRLSAAQDTLNNIGNVTVAFKSRK